MLGDPQHANCVKLCEWYLPKAWPPLVVRACGSLGRTHPRLYVGFCAFGLVTWSPHVFAANPSAEARCVCVRGLPGGRFQSSSVSPIWRFDGASKRRQVQALIVLSDVDGHVLWVTLRHIIRRTLSLMQHSTLVCALNQLVQAAKS